MGEYADSIERLLAAVQTADENGRALVPMPSIRTLPQTAEDIAEKRAAEDRETARRRRKEDALREAKEVAYSMGGIPIRVSGTIVRRYEEYVPGPSGLIGGGYPSARTEERRVSGLLTTIETVRVTVERFFGGHHVAMLVKHGKDTWEVDPTKATVIDA